MAYRPNVKVRLGIVNAFGEQKGVDGLIVTDLINLSRNRAMSDVVLVTGDEDIRVGVQQAQKLGMRVHLVGIANAQHNQSNLLRQEADTLHEISKADVDTFLTRTVAPTPLVVVPTQFVTVPPAAPVAAVAAVAPVPPVTIVTLAEIATTFAASIPKPDSDRVATGGRGVPQDLDRQLLKAGRDLKASSLNEQEKRELRRVFITACKARV